MDKEIIKDYIKAGKIASEVCSHIRKFAKPKMKLIDIALEVDRKIEELGGEPAFPVNLSLNEIAAHYTPEIGDETIAQGILKVDLGVCINGYIADTAFSIDLTEDKKFEKMIELNEKILREIEKIIKSGFEVHEVGEKVFEVLEEFNQKEGTDFSIIKSLSGHELGRDTIHAGLTFSNYRNENKTKIYNMAFAIEPFVTSGVGDIYEGKEGGIYVLHSDRPVRDRESRELLNFIKEKYKTHPFCLRWLEKEGFTKLKFTISNLIKSGILYQYPLLIEKSKSPVSQFEHTFVVNGEKVICTTK
ncbi:MAG: type II methionyl aminopeptidase [Candidatus Pacearchaeota archaeon]